jgi:hypothetical protein
VPRLRRLLRHARSSPGLRAPRTSPAPGSWPMLRARPYRRRACVPALHRAPLCSIQCSRNRVPRALIEHPRCLATGPDRTRRSTTRRLVGVASSNAERAVAALGP